MNNIIEKLNIPYSNNKSDDQQKLDLFYSKDYKENGKNRILLVYVHGGFWVARDKNDYLEMGRYLVNQNGNVAVATVNYRLSKEDGGEIIYPKHNFDLIESIIWLYNNNKDEEGNEIYSNSKIILWGHSCGGHMISTVPLYWDNYLNDMLNQSEYQYLKNNSNDYYGIKESYIGLIGIQGLYDFKSLIQDFPNYSRDVNIAFGNQENWFDLLDINESKLNKSKVQWLLIHSPDDTWVNSRQSISAVEHLQNKLGFVNVKLDENVNGAHFPVVMNFANVNDKESLKTREIINNFLNKF